MKAGMLTVKTYLDKSPIAGLGVFAAENITRDQMIWTFVIGFDRIMTEEERMALPEPARSYLETYAFWENGKIVFTGDNDRYTNHSEASNTYVAENGNIHARTDIAKGTEIRGNYKDFDEKWQKKLQK